MAPCGASCIAVVVVAAGSVGVGDARAAAAAAAAAPDLHSISPGGCSLLYDVSPSFSSLKTTLRASCCMASCCILASPLTPDLLWFSAV